MREKVAGKIVAARSSFSSAGKNLPMWKRRRASGGGALLDLASHQFDMVSYVLDRKIVAVQALMNSNASDEDTVAVQLRMSDDTLVSVFTSIAAVEQHRMEVPGTERELVLDRYRSSRLKTIPATRDFSRASRVRAALATFAGFPTSIRDALAPPSERSFQAALECFVHSSLGEPDDGMAQLAPNIESGLRSLAAVSAAEESARTGQVVQLFHDEV